MNYILQVYTLSTMINMNVMSFPLTLAVLQQCHFYMNVSTLLSQVCALLWDTQVVVRTVPVNYLLSFCIVCYYDRATTSSGINPGMVDKFSSFDQAIMSIILGTC